MSSYIHIHVVCDEWFCKRIDRSSFQRSVKQGHHLFLFNDVFCFIFK